MSMISKIICIASLVICPQFNGILCLTPRNESEPEIKNGTRISRKERAVGGQYPSGEKYPFMISFMYNNVHQCGGTIHTKDIILTAAHCAETRWVKKMSVRVGSERSDYGGRIYNVTKVSTHIDHVDGTPNYDIALLRVEPPIDFGEAGGVVKLYNFYESFPLEKPGVAIGWGLTNFPANLKERKPSPLYQRIDVKILAKDDCQSRKPNWKPSQLCTISENKTTCSGDSGGPLLVLENAEWHQVGVLASSPCALGRIGLMNWAEVSAHSRWIQDESAALLSPSHLPYARKPFSPTKEQHFKQNWATKIPSLGAPWTVVVMPADILKSHCSGAIIHRQHVLTQASCLETGGVYTVYTSTSFDYDVVGVFRAENYYTQSVDTPIDLAVLRVHEPFEFGLYVSKIDIADSNAKVERKMLAYLYFWHSEKDENLKSKSGKISLYAMNMSIRLKDECNGIYEQSNEGHVYEKQICGTNYYGMCMNQLGGPLVIPTSSGMRLLGVYSWKKFCEDYQFPSVFTEVAPYRNWIEETYTAPNPEYSNTFRIMASMDGSCELDDEL